MNILKVYENYKITYNLQRHQLRVAAVAKQLCDNLTVTVDADTVVTACLIHDLGNVLKFDFSSPAEWFEPEGKDYWRRVQRETAERYGTTDEHLATVRMARELGVSRQIIRCIESIDFKKTLQTLKAPEIEPKICDYADLRVAPDGVVSLHDRLEEGHRRYKDRPDKWLSDDRRQIIVRACHDNETQLFVHSKIGPQDITDDSVAPIIKRLETYEI